MTPRPRLRKCPFGTGLGTRLRWRSSSSGSCNRRSRETLAFAPILTFCGQRSRTLNQKCRSAGWRTAAHELRSVLSKRTAGSSRCACEGLHKPRATLGHDSRLQQRLATNGSRIRTPSCMPATRGHQIDGADYPQSVPFSRTPAPAAYSIARYRSPSHLASANSNFAVPGTCTVFV
jgi:hypothetical protein